MMKQQAIVSQKEKAYIKNSTLILLAFSTAFFSRIIVSAGAPPNINFLHFAIAPFACGVALAKTRTKDSKQISISWALLAGILILFGVVISSAFVNNAGTINAVLDFMLLAEPFMILLAIVCISMSTATFKRFRGWVLGSAFINLFLAFVQKVLLSAGILSATGQWGTLDDVDGVQGVFFVSGAGNYVSASISMYLGLYYMTLSKKTSIWIRLSILLAAFLQLIISDSKQVLLAFALAWILLTLTKSKDIAKTLIYLIATVVVIVVFLWLVQNLESLSAFKNWTDRMELYGPNGEGTQIKTVVFRIIPSYYESSLNWLLGLGPGHTVGRLGGWMLKDYRDLLEPLGATIHPASQAVWRAVFSSWVAQESTIFSPFFGWAGIWGDLGLLGLGAYLYLSFLVWHHLCKDDFSKFLLLTVFVFGLIFTQMEEPGYMISVAMMIGLRWHEQQLLSRTIIK